MAVFIAHCARARPRSASERSAGALTRTHCGGKVACRMLV